MKKILTIALVALLAASTAFAGLSGKATLNLGYNTKTGAYGFENGKGFSVDLDLASETAENVAEGDVYAGVKATFTLKLADRSSTNAVIFGDGADVGFGALFSLKEAYIAGQDWKVSITGTQSGPDFAKSAIDTEFDDWSYDDFGGQYVDPSTAEYVPVTYKVSVNKAPGVTATYKDWSLALGFNGGKADSKTGAPDFFNYHASLFTPELTLVDGLTLKAAAVASGIKNATDVTEYTTYWIIGTVVDKRTYVESKNYDAFGASLEVAYVADAFSAKLDADFGMKKTVGTDEFKPGFDLAANAVAYGVTVDAYYQYGEETQFVSAQVKADLNTFDVPVVIKAYGKNMADDKNGQTFGGSVEGTISAFTLTVGGEYTVSNKKYSLNGSVAYKAKLFTAKAGLNFSKIVDVDKSEQLYASASVESDALVPGATLKLAYAPNTAKSDDKKYTYTTTNFLNSDLEDYGKVTASCTIKF